MDVLKQRTNVQELSDEQLKNLAKFMRDKQDAFESIQGWEDSDDWPHPDMLLGDWGDFNDLIYVLATKRIPLVRELARRGFKWQDYLTDDETQSEGYEKTWLGETEA
jgi:hypothetical protein